MNTHELDTDYLVVGTGAMGLAFADELIRGDPSAEIILVDRRAKPGGHWNDAYAFVSLHQPAAYYGVNSLALGRGGAALASGDEVLAYLGQVLARLLATGRVRHFPMCDYDYEGEGQFRSLLAPDTVYRARVRRKTVDATYMKVEVPATTAPKYEAAPGVSLVPINALVKVEAPRSGYVIIGAGKTGIDAVLFLLDRGVDPELITWIVSNDAWLWLRERIQPGRMLDFYFVQVEALSRAQTLDALVMDLESKGIFCRLDPTISPTKFRCATVSEPELRQLRRVSDIVRMGRVVCIEDDAIVLERGRVASDSDRLYVDCTADGLAKRTARPVFEGSHIRLQSVLMCQQVFSAALIAYVETRSISEAESNALCQVVPHPEWTHDFITAQHLSIVNLESWTRAFLPWLLESRLCFAHHESRLGLLAMVARLLPMKSTIDRQVARLEAQHSPGSVEPELEPTVQLEHGPLRSTAYLAGAEHPKTRPLVVCLHGFPDNARSFRHQLPVLAAHGYRVIAPTLRGYEPSSQPADNDYSLVAVARDLIAWLDHLGEERVHLVGHDWGAAVAYLAGALAPERFRSLTTVAVPHFARFIGSVPKVPSQALNSWYMLFFQLPGLSEGALERDDWALIRRLWADWSPGFELPEAEWARLRETFAAPGVKRAMLSYYRQNLFPAVLRAFDRYVRVPVPTLAITGANDGCIDTRLFEHVFRADDFSAGFRIERITDAGHFVHQERPDVFNRALLSWLGEH